MPAPPRNDIIIGLFLVIAGLISALCDQWALKTKAEGRPTMKAHPFNHIFLVWTFKQILLALLLPLWKAIDSDWMGMGRFRHAEFDHGERERRNNRVQNILHPQENEDDPNQLLPVQNPLPNGPENLNRPINEADDPNQPVNGPENLDRPVNEPALGNDENENDRQPLIPRGQLVNAARPHRRRQKKYTKALFFPPAVFNQAHIILIYFGMRLTYSSSMIMLKGSEPVFVFLLALAFLAQQIAVYKWIGVIIMASGFAISGLSDYIHIVPDGYEPYGIAAGDLLFTMSQITLATQMIYEEKFMRKLSIHPMKFLGSEGIYSMIFSILCLIIFNCVDTVQYTELPNYRIEDIVDAFIQLGNCWCLVIAMLGSIFSYVVFMYLGMLIIKEYGAMVRIMISMMSWAIFYAISIGVKWQNFYITQIPGLVMVPCGLLIYSHILPLPFLKGDNMAGEIGPNEFLVNHDENNAQNDEAGPAPPDGADHYDEPYDYNDDERLINDGANGAVVNVGGDEQMLRP